MFIRACMYVKIFPLEEELQEELLTQWVFFLSSVKLSYWVHGNLTLFLLNTPNSLNTVNCCGNTDLPLLMPWDLEFLTVSCLLCWDLTSCSVAFLCFLSGCASQQTDSWCSLVEVIFLDPMHLSHAEISGFARWLISCHSSLQLLVSRCFLLGYKIREKIADIHHCGELKMLLSV